MRTVRIGACIALAVALTGCGNMTPQERQNAAAAFGAVVGGAAAAAGAYANARYAQPVYVQPVYVRPAPRWNPYCWQSAVTGQWMGCMQ